MINAPIQDGESIDEALKKLKAFLNKYQNQFPKSSNSQEFKIYNDLSAQLIKHANTKQNQFIKISEENGKIIWGNPQDPYNEEKQITYNWNQHEKKYTITSGKQVNAYIFNNKSSDTELVIIKNGHQESYGKQNLFKISNRVSEEPNDKAKEAVILDIESQKRFNSKFKIDSNLRVTRPFFVNNTKNKFDKLKNNLLSANNKTALEAFNKINDLAKANHENAFIHTIHAVPYCDQEDNWTCGFDDNDEIRGEERHYSKSGSKYSFAYNIEAENPEKINIIASEKTCNAYIAAIRNPGSENQIIELLEIGDNPNIAKLHNITGASNNTQGKIINYDLKKNKDCPSLCQIIRMSGNSRLYGIEPYYRTKKFITKFENIISNQFAEENVEMIKKALAEALSIDYTNALVMTFAPKLLSEDLLEEAVKKALNEIGEQNNLEEKELVDIFVGKVNLWKKQKIHENQFVKEDISSKFEEVTQTPMLPLNIKIDPEYELKLSFNDKNCKDEKGDSYPGVVFIFSKKNTEFHIDKQDMNKDKIDDSFILELTDTHPINIRARLGGSPNIVNTIISCNNHTLQIKNDALNFTESNSSPFKNTCNSTYFCRGCISYYEGENQELIFNFNNFQYEVQNTSRAK